MLEREEKLYFFILVEVQVVFKFEPSVLTLGERVLQGWAQGDPGGLRAWMVSSFPWTSCSLMLTGI